MTNSVYQPAEDSTMLAAAVEEHAYGKVLDVGTGSGIQAMTAAKSKKVTSVVAVDINDDALKFAEAAAKKESVKITFKRSNLFSGIKGKFDTIIFNPPYLPQDRGITDEAIYGGKHGYELLQQFIDSCRDYISDSGIALIVFSSRTNKQKVDEAIEKNCLEFEELEQKYLFFETLHVYKIRKPQLLLQLQQKKIENPVLHAKGNRGIVYKATHKGKTVAVKAQRKDTAAVAAIENEIKWLKMLNKEGIGPKLLTSGKDWLACEFVSGEFILEFISSREDKQQVIAVVKDVLLQARKLDKLKVNKEEMLRPQRHVIVDEKAKAVMLDFERCHKSEFPKNVTQFCQFLTSGYFISLLRQKGIQLEKDSILAAAKEYNHNQNNEKFKNIEKLIGKH
ncbi:methyltransferase [Candidatus Woesearchaeota archaeon]|nr:methyltransferase [Candidatus Woesearchaeota archaeon]